MVINGIYYNINGNEASVTYIEYVNVGNHAYYNYYNKYSNHVTIPETVTYNGLTYTVTEIGQHAFENCTLMTSITIPNTVIAIGNEAFYKCSGLKNITIPNSVTSIGGGAFYDCDGLSSLLIPNSLLSISNDTFADCSNLSNVVIGNSVTYINSYAFVGCPLTYITCLGETPPNVSTNYNVFSSYANTTLYVPAVSIEAYSAAAIWKNFKIITDFKPNYLSLDDVSTMRGDTIVVPVMMENENEITAFQTDIYLVDGFDVVMDENDEYLVELSDRKGRDHVIMASETPDGAIRVASYSPTLKTFKNNEGELFYITVKVPENGNGVYPLILEEYPFDHS